MITESISAVDALIVNAHWRWLHGVWAADPDAVEQARVAIDALLERRYEMTTATAPAAFSPP